MTEHEHAVPPTTHTVNLVQVAEINERLAAHALPAADVGVDAPAGATLVEVVMEGSPTFGYLWGRLGDDSRVLMHTDHLRAVSKALHLPHHWGI